MIAFTKQGKSEYLAKQKEQLKILNQKRKPLDKTEKKKVITDSNQSRKSFFLGVMLKAIRFDPHHRKGLKEFLQQHKDLAHNKFSYAGKEMTILEIAKHENNEKMIALIEGVLSENLQKPKLSAESLELLHG